MWFIRPTPKNRLIYYICIMKTLAERLIWSRKQKQLSQSELADMVGVVQSTIGNLEAGSRFFSRKITSIAAVLGVNARWLAEGTGQPCDDKKSKEARPISHQEQVILDLIAALPESEQKKLIVFLKEKKKEYDVLLKNFQRLRGSWLNDYGMHRNNISLRISGKMISQFG